MVMKSILPSKLYVIPSGKSCYRLFISTYYNPKSRADCRDAPWCILLLCFVDIAIRWLMYTYYSVNVVWHYYE